MKSYKTEQTELFRFEMFEDYHEVKHFISGREGGCSKAPFNGLNLGFGTDDAPENVLENRFILGCFFSLKITDKFSQLFFW